MKETDYSVSLRTHSQPEGGKRANYPTLCSTLLFHSDEAREAPEISTLFLGSKIPSKKVLSLASSKITAYMLSTEPRKKRVHEFGTN